MNHQTALLYGIYYSFFEVFALVYPPIYGFNLGELGLTFITVGVACIIGVTIFNVYLLFYLVPDIQKNGLRAPEHRLVPALFGVCALPVGFFLFGKFPSRPVSSLPNQFGERRLRCHNRMDSPRLRPLDSRHDRGHHRHHLKLLHLPMRLCLPPPILPALHRQLVRE